MNDLQITEKFEYKIVEIKEKGLFLTKFKRADIEHQLNFHGERGWELASSFSTDLDNNGKKEVILIFKRKVVIRDS